MALLLRSNSGLVSVADRDFLWGAQGKIKRDPEGYLDEFRMLVSGPLSLRGLLLSRRAFYKFGSSGFSLDEWEAS
jgi:hypothetical protein